MKPPVFKIQNDTTLSNTKLTKKISIFHWLIILVVSILSLIFLSLVNPLSGATYYYISGPINTLSSWKTNSNGTGSSPTSFTSGSNTFIIWNSISSAVSPTLTGIWTVGGGNTIQIGTSTAGATLSIIGGTLNLQGNSRLFVGATSGTVSKKLYIESNGLLNITSGATNPLRVYNNATLTIASTSFPSANQVYLNTGNPGSYVEWAQNANVTIWRKTYANLIISGTGIKQIAGGGTVRVLQQLQMLSGGLQMSSNTNATLRLSGTITGTAPILTNNSNLQIDGAGTSFGTIYFANGATPMSIRNFIVNTTGLKNITLGTNLTVNNNFNFSNGVINLNDKQLTLNGAITLPTSTTNGYFIGSKNSSIVIGGAGTITNNLLMSSSTLTTSSLYNFTMNRNGRNITIGNSLNIWGELTATQGTITSNGNITIKADISQRGRVGPIGTNADIAGIVKVETFAKGGSTGWTQLAVSGVASQSVANWASNFPVTCPTGCAISNTFVSIYSYSEAAVANCYSCSPHYVPISNSLTPLNTGQGYYVYLGTSTYTTSDIVITLQGNLIKKSFGTIPLTLTGPAGDQNGWNLIGNPYASPISFAKILSSMGSASVNIENTIYVWNPDLSGGAGDYAIYNPNIGSIPPVSSGGIDDNIPMGQGFFVRAINPVNLSPNENWKSSTNSQNFLLKTLPNASNNPHTTSFQVFPPSMFVLEMKGPNNYDVYTGISVHPNATANFDNQYDATQLGSDWPAPQIMTVLNNYAYKINTIPLPSGTFTMEIKVITGTSGNYTIMPLNLNNFPSGTCINLYDKFTGTTHNLKSGNYAFYLSDTTTVPRFILTITNNPISITSALLQQPSCNYSNNGILAVSVTGGTAPFQYIWKDINGNVLATHTSNFTSDTLYNVYPGMYFCDISSASLCSGGIASFTILPTNTVLPLSSFNLLTNDTLPLNFSQPFVAQNASSNTSAFLWEVLGDGYTSSSSTFSYMPSQEGDYIIRLYAISACNDTSIYEQPIVVITGPDSPSFEDAPDFSPFGEIPVDTNYIITTLQNQSNLSSITINKDENGYYIVSPYETNANLYVTDILGRILYEEKNIHLSPSKKYITLPSSNILLLNIETNQGRKIMKIIQ